MQRFVSILQNLIRLPSINPMGRTWPSEEFILEHRVTGYLESLFREMGVSYHRQPVAPGRENIIARVDVPGATRTILFEVHQDTVPVEAMIIPPFGGEIREGRLYGRGACDVKGSMAGMLCVLERLHREKPAGAANLILACTVDEEHTFLGIQQLMNEGMKADLAIVAEPTKLQIVDAHKGVARWKVRTPGKACHSSTPEKGINAIYRMGHLLTAIEEYADNLQRSRLIPRLGAPTLSVGRIEGGVSVNTVPDACVIEIDRRLLPGESALEAVEDFRQNLKVNFDFICDPLWMSCPALEERPANLASRLLGNAIDAVIGRHEVLAVPFGTDASTIAEGNIPTVVFGPGDIAQAHTSDEWIELKQIETAMEILWKLVTE